MSDNGANVNSAWKLEIDETGARRIRNTSREDGVPSLPMEKKLVQVFVGLAGGAQLLGDEFSSRVIQSKSEELAYGWALLAQENDGVHTAISWMLETSAWGEAIVPTAMVGGMIAWHYGLLPDKFGYPLSQLSGVTPLSREQEIELRKRAQAQAQAQAAARADEEAAEAVKEFTEQQVANTNGAGTAPDVETPNVSTIVEVPDEPSDD